MQRSRKLMLLALLFAASWLPRVQADASANTEIQHLFEFIGRSGCIFIRNGTEYEAEEAREHMQSKYDYGRRWIDSAEQFIERVATSSSMSGNRYQVRCQGQLLYSDNWLKDELGRYRAVHGAGPQTAEQ